MEWIYNQQDIDRAYKKWVRLGFCANETPTKDAVDPEKLIVETTHIGRYDGRLFKAMLTWIRDFHDLINIQRIVNLIEEADIPVLGAVFDIAMQNCADFRFKTIIKHCRPFPENEALFKAIDVDGNYEEYQKEHAKDEYLKWGIYGTLLEFYEDAMLDRKTVLKRNPLLAIRALIGPNIRSEILNELLKNTRVHIRALSQKIGYAYSAVYKEVHNMGSNGFLQIEIYGKTKVVLINQSFLKYISSVPVS